MVTQLDTDIWTYDGPEVVFAGAPMHTRMTVVRLGDGRLWIHSPIALGDEVREFVRGLGNQVAALVAPNKFHHMYVNEWRVLFPSAAVFAEEHLMRRVAAMNSAQMLNNTTPDLYSADIDQVVFDGSRLFQEVVFFHKASRTLILTDLMINLKTESVPLLPRLFLEFEGVVHPHGGVARLYRWFTSDKTRARVALEVVKGWQPERLVYCHGEPFELSAKEILAQEFAYLD